MINKINKYSLYVILFVLVFFSSDGFALTMVNAKNIYIKNITIMDILCIIFIVTSIILIISKYRYNKLNFNKIKPKLSIIMLFWILVILWGTFVSIVKGVEVGYSVIFGYPMKYIFYSLIICFIIEILYVYNFIKIINIFLFFLTIKCIIGLINYFFGVGYSYGFLNKIVFPFGDILTYVVLGYSLALNNIILFLKNKNYKLMIKSILQYSIFFLVIMFSMRRTYMLGIIIVTCIIFILNKGREKRLLIFFMIFSIIISASTLYITNNDLFNSMSKRLYSINIFKSNNDDPMLTDNGHIEDTLDAIDNLKDNKLIGNGFYTPVIRYRVGWQGSNTFFHIGIIDSWVKMGIMGVVMYVVTFLLPIIYLFKKIYLNKIKLEAISLVAFIVAFFVQSFSEGAFYSSVGRSMIYFIFLGIAFSIGKIERMKDYEYTSY